MRNFLQRIAGRARKDFRTRSAGRDARLDRERFDRLLCAVRDVQDAMRREHDGLAHRLDADRCQVAGLLGSEPLEYLDRDRASERRLARAEAGMRQGAARLDRLSVTLSELRQVEGAVLRLRALGGR